MANRQNAQNQPDDQTKARIAFLTLHLSSLNYSATNIEKQLAVLTTGLKETRETIYSIEKEINALQSSFTVRPSDEHLAGCSTMLDLPNRQSSNSDQLLGIKLMFCD